MNKLKEKISKILKIKIKETFNKNLEDIKEELKFIIFIDHFYKERNWLDRIKKIVEDKFNTREMLLKKGEIIMMFNKKSKFEKAIECLNEEADKVIKDIIQEIKAIFYNKEIKETEIKRLEHMIMKQRLGDINYDTAVNIVSEILSQRILKSKGMFNKNLFNENEKIEKKQYVKIFLILLSRKK